MRTRKIHAVPVIAALTVMGMSTHSAAADPAETPLTLDVTGDAILRAATGALTISVPSTRLDLGSRESAVGGVLSGPLGAVTVHDTRGGGDHPEWVASAVSTNFTTQDGASIPASAVSYSVGHISHTGHETIVGHDRASLSGLAPVVTAVGSTSEASAAWTPTISVAVPAGTVSGIYTATITHSVA